MPKTLISQRSTGTKVAFGDVVQLSRERSSDPERDGHERFVGLEHIDPSDLRIRRWGNVADGVTFTSVFRPGQVLFGKRRAYQRKVAVADFSGVCSGDIYVLESKGSALLPELLPFICQTEAFFEHAVGTSAGSLSPRTNWESLASFEFTLPPIEEQRRITDVLAATGTVVDAVDGLRHRTRNLYESALNSAFPALASGADERSAAARILLGTVCEVRPSGVDKHSRAGEREVWLCNYLDVYRNGIIDRNRAFMKATATDREIDRYGLRRGDVIITKDSEEPTDIAVPSRVAEDLNDVLCGYHLAILRPDRSKIDSVYLTHALRAPASRRYFRTVAQGMSRFGLTLDAIRSTPLPAEDLAAQVRTGQLLESLYKGIECIDKRLASSKEYQRSVRETILSGSRK